MRVRLRDGEVIPDRDCVLSWQPKQDQARPTLQVMLHDDRASEQVYFLGLVAPPAVHSPGHGVPREVILLVDHSGSMEGAKWEAADWAVKKFLAELTERDSFALCLFHTTTRWFSKTPRKAEAEVVEEALRFLEEHKDSGGTELGVALEQALGIKRAKGEHARHILIITDAQVTDAGRILRLADQEFQQADRRRISVLCIDAAPNSFLASQLAERGGGVAKFLTSSPEEKDISTALDEVLADWAEPVLSGLRLSVNRQDVQAAGREVLTTEARESLIDLSDLPAGRTIWVAGRAPRGETKDLTFRVTTTDNREVADCCFDLAKEAIEQPALKALFGARRVMGLEFLIHSGYDPKDLQEQLERLGYDSEKVLTDLKGKTPKVYAENVRAEATEALLSLLIKEALDYGIACSETAFVAVRTEAGKQVEGSVAVANALPAEWSDDFLAVSPGIYRVGGRATSVAQPMDAVDMAQPVMCLRMANLSPSAPRASVSMMRETPAGPLRTKAKVLFSGIPQFENGEAVLFDTSRKQDADKLPDSTVINRLEVRFPAGTPEHKNLAGLSLLIFVDDLSSPKAKVRLADVVRQRGERPLNLLRRAGQVLRLVLLDLDGSWVQIAPTIEVTLGWKAMSG